jgi:SAM-dependent methyltransferase
VAIAGENGREVATNDYDLLPYLSMPLSWGQPSRLAAMAVLHGLEPPPADRARVLELGCASGGHIIPLAARFPHAHFLGIDLGRRHVEDALRRIATLGLANVAVQLRDIAEADFGGEQFDYIIAHGVFSWVPEQVQNAVLRICRDHLSERGLAVVSYNVLPGWHQRRIVRDVSLASAGNGPPSERVARVRTMLKELAASTDPGTPYGQLLRSEAERLSTVPGSYILGEFLSTHNEPFYFQDFIVRARTFGLDYLAECDVASSLPEGLAALAAARIRAIAGPERIALQHMTDVFSGRTFRRSILVRQKAAAGGTPDRGRLTALHIASFLKLDPTSSQGGGAVFMDQRKRTIEIRDEAVSNAFVRLGESYPATKPVQELAAAVPDVTAKRRVLDALFRLLETARATISSVPLDVARESDPRPRAWAVARAEAATGDQPWVTSLTHGPVILNSALRFLVPLMDDTCDRKDLVAQLAKALQQGKVEAPETQDAAGVINPAKLEDVAADMVARALKYLAANAVLEPASS